MLVGPDVQRVSWTAAKTKVKNLFKNGCRLNVCTPGLLGIPETVERKAQCHCYDFIYLVLGQVEKNYLHDT